ALCDNLAGEINKTYQHLPWALKHEAVSRLKRQVHELSQKVSAAQDSSSLNRTQKLLQDSVSLTHECVPLMSLCLKKNLLSSELHDRWVRRLNEIGKHLEVWLKAGPSPKD
ncbi:MAG TPA: hypothetical protein VK859_04700, partial [bacterium]|nr:hypothetical protein [bacterium]